MNKYKSEIMDRIKRDPIAGKSIRSTRILKSCLEGFRTLYDIASTYEKNNNPSTEQVKVNRLMHRAVNCVKILPFKNGIRYSGPWFPLGIKDLEMLLEEMLKKAQITTDPVELEKLNLRIDILTKQIVYSKQPYTGIYG